MVHDAHIVIKSLNEEYRIYRCDLVLKEFIYLIFKIII